jgi:general secretion pathway protein D
MILYLCLLLLASHFFPQAAQAARIAGDKGTVTTAAPPTASPPASATEKKAAVQTDSANQPIKAKPQIETPKTPVTRPAPAEAPSFTPVQQTTQPAETGTPAAAMPTVVIPTATTTQTPSEADRSDKQITPDAPAGAPVEVKTQPQQTQSITAPAPSARKSKINVHNQRYVTIDFDSVDIHVFIKFISELTGKNFIVDDKVKGKVTIISPRKIAVDEVYKVFESVMEVNGFAVVPSGDVIKIIQSQQAREKSLETRLQDEQATNEDKYVTQIISLEHANPDEMKRVLDPLISRTSVILSYPPAGMLVITEILSNIKRLRKIIEALDVDGVGGQISYVPLKYAAATEAIKSLNAIFQQQKGTIAPVKIVADDRTNALIIAATENETTRVRELIDLMDREIPKGSGMIRVYYLQNAKAEDTAKVLSNLPHQAKTPDGKPVPLSKSVQIVADKATNALIITADTADYLVIEDVIKKLDISRPMVYLEALIMEVSTTKNFKLGVEWQGGKDFTYDGKTGAVVGGVSGDGGKYGIASGLLTTTAGAIPTLPSGLSLGVIGQAITVATVGGTTLTFPNLAAFIQAYQSDTDVRILSTPQLLTLDNEEAEITVGKNVPYVTRQDTTTTSTINYSNYEYKDVGITLKVTPQINKEGFIRMKLDQSVTKLDAQTQDIGTGLKILAPTTLKRTAKTTITVRSGDTVVIGGLIENYSSDGVYKVPLLGDIPLLGWLFKYKSRIGDRTNLFIFITPRIIQKPEDAVNIHQDKKGYMDALKEGVIKTTPPKKN